MAAETSTQEAGAPRKVTFCFDDGVEKEVAVAHDEFVLDAALRQNVPLVHQCRSGSCSTCVAQLIAGNVEMTHERSTSLIAAEAAEGKRLLCSAYARADSAVRLSYPSTLIYEGAPRVFAATVGALEWPAETVAKLTLELSGGADFAFHSGQYVRVRIPETDQWRSYSMASVSRDVPILQFLVRIIPGGAMSEYLRGRCHGGDALEVEGPRGAFILRESRAPHIFVAGGTGLAPILSMIDAIRRHSGARPSMTLSFGCASDAQFFYRDEVELRQWWMPSLKLILSADRVGSPESGLITGTPVAALGHVSVGDGATVAYLCGPPPMIAAARKRLEELGVKPEHIYAENFVPS
ncbi:MAG: FAD-binding oxidoreductase [Candidatus Binataceae bacterium]